MIDVCQNCGRRDREVNRADEHDLWLCVPCYQRMPGGYYLADEDMSPPPLELRDLYPSRVFKPLPRRRLPSNSTVIAWLDDQDRHEAEMWLRYGPDWRKHEGDAKQPRAPRAGVEALKCLPSAEYVPALSGREIRSGYIECPFHGDGEQRSPSLQVYEEGWYCHGCGKGGSIIDFAAALWDIAPRGDGFHEICDRLERELP